MKITALVENTALGESCVPAHGLSLYIEAEGCRILMDAGPSELLLTNAETLGISLETVDLAVLSHGHYDHADGLSAFASVNPKAPVYLRTGAGNAFYSASQGTPRYIGMSPEAAGLTQLRWVDDDVSEIAPGVLLFGGVTERECWPQSNLRLSVRQNDQNLQDHFSHEQSLVLRENGHSVLFSGCAHNGVVNILRRYEELFHSLPDAVVSGFHMMKSSPYTPEEEDTIRQTAVILSEFPCVFYTCHCTGLPAYDMLKEIMGEKLHYLHCGHTLALSFSAQL